MSDKFDLVVIGGGPGGYVAAIRASQLGLSVALVEKAHLGGVCLNWGCIPTKALLRSSEIYNYIKNASEYGIEVTGFKANLSNMVDRSRKVAEKLSGGIKLLLKKNKVTVFEAHAKLKNNNTIELSGDGNKTVTAKNIILATGARARDLKGFEADGKLVLSYKDAMMIRELPKKLLVVGSGAIGVEFASFFNSLGSEVTILEVQDKILPTEDEEISKYAEKVFIEQGMIIKKKANLISFKKENNSVKAEYECDGQRTTQNFDKVIMAVGIVANTDNLGLENTKVKLEKTHVLTNEFMQTEEKNIYAIGDITGSPWLAHKASHEGIIAAEKIAGKEVHGIKKENIPGCIYSNPQVASVGLTEKKALELGHKIKVGKFPFSANGKAIALGDTHGFIKTIFDEKTGELLGAHMVGAEVTELIQSFVLAKNMEVTEEDFMHTIFPHPTLSEMIHESVLDAYKRAIHI